MDEDSIADLGVWQSIGLVHPAMNSARMTLDDLGEGLDIGVIVEEPFNRIRGHGVHGPDLVWTVHANMRMSRAVSSRIVCN
jgi:hypothetical protein